MTTVEPAEIDSHSFTDVGRFREDNQDAVRLCNPDDDFTAAAGHLYGVADGMGGYAHGGVASTLALETFFSTFYASNGASPFEKFRVSIQNANLSVYQTSQRMGVGRMGTTLTVANIIGRTLYIGHIGDSRAYLIRDNKATCLTKDHTRVGELVRMRMLPPEKVRTHSQRSILNKCLGINIFVQPDIFKITVQNGDVVVLCTDGVWSVIEDEEFAQLTKSTKDPEDLNRQISKLVMERESDDNLSAIALNLRSLAMHETTNRKEPLWDLGKIFRRFKK